MDYVTRQLKKIKRENEDIYMTIKIEDDLETLTVWVKDDKFSANPTWEYPNDFAYEYEHFSCSYYDLLNDVREFIEKINKEKSMENLTDLDRCEEIKLMKRLMEKYKDEL